MLRSNEFGSSKISYDVVEMLIRIRTLIIEYLFKTSIAREVMMSQLIKLGLISPEAPNNLISITQQMWANNGDVISKQYAGTNALKV